MKGKLKTSIISILAIFGTMSFVSCGTNNDNTNENSQNINMQQNTTENINQLATPKLSITDNYLYWNKIPHADYYQIYMNGQFWKVALEPQQEIDVGVNGNYVFNVEAKSLNEDYLNSSMSNSVELIVKRNELAEPVISIEHGKISWNAVEGATNYEIYINGYPTQIEPNIVIKNNQCCWTLDENVTSTSEIYIISKSNRDDYETNSDNSNKLTIKMTDTKTWNAKKLCSEMECEKVSYSNQLAVFKKNGYLSSYLNVDKNYSYLFLEKMSTANNFEVKVNGKIIESSIYDSCVYRYDLSEFKGQGVNLTILANAEDSISSLSLRKKNKASPLTKWETSEIKNEWLSFGNSAVHTEGFCLENEGEKSGIINNLLISGNKRYLTFSVRKFIRSEEQDLDAKLKVYVNGSVIKAIDTAEDYVLVNSDTFTTFIYDLSEYLNQVVTVKIENIQGEHACFNKIWLGTKGKYSISTSWDASFIEEEWNFNGDVKIHTEGVCLENNGAEASISNDVLVQKNHLKISFRKFVRSGAQDLDPKIIVKINNTLVKAVGIETDYVSATTDDYSPFLYDLSSYNGQVVNIKIINVEGEHACFNELSLID